MPFTGSVPVGPSSAAHTDGSSKVLSMVDKFEGTQRMADGNLAVDGGVVTPQGNTNKKKQRIGENEIVSNLIDRRERRLTGRNETFKLELSRPSAVRALLEVQKRSKADVIFLSETHLEDCPAECLKRGLKMYFKEVVVSNGRSGGLLLYWRKEVELTLRFKTGNFIDVGQAEVGGQIFDMATDGGFACEQ